MMNYSSLPQQKASGTSSGYIQISSINNSQIRRITESQIFGAHGLIGFFAASQRFGNILEQHLAKTIEGPKNPKFWCQSFLETLLCVGTKTLVFWTSQCVVRFSSKMYLKPAFCQHCCSYEDSNLDPKGFISPVPWSLGELESELHQITKLQKTIVFLQCFRFLHESKRDIEGINVEEAKVLR